MKSLRLSDGFDADIEPRLAVITDNNKNKDNNDASIVLDFNEYIINYVSYSNVCSLWYSSFFLSS